MFKSLRVRFTLIFFILVFIAMALAGVFIIYAFEDHNHQVVTKRLDEIAEIITYELDKLGNDSIVDAQYRVQEIIDQHAAIGLREEIYIIDNKEKKIIASSTSHVGKYASEVIDNVLILQGFEGVAKESNFELPNEVRTKDKVYPIKQGNENVATLYLRYDLSDIYQTLSKARMIILQSVLLSLFATLVIGAVLSKRITDPINEVTQKASLLAEGDFSQLVEVKSDDEIGMLSQTFNFLSLELKKSVGEISQEKSKLEAIVNYMEDGLIAINADGQIIHSNPKAINMLTIDGHFSEDLIGDLLSIYSSGRLNGENGTKNIIFNHRTLRVNFAPFLDELSNKVGVVFVFQDVTEQEKLDNMRREFVANVSHELKTPLTSIKSYTETLLDGAVDDPDMQRSFLTVVNTEADRMTRLVRDLLELSNFDSQSTQLRITSHNIIELINNCILKVKVTADQKKQKIETYFHDDIQWVEIDGDRIEQVILNILSNAIKYTEDKGTVTIELRNGHDEGHFEVVITDSGMGIPQEDLSRIFERFYRVDKARSRALGGTGLGLSIAKEIVEAHNGQISIDSEVEIGTKVVLMLPIEKC